MMITLESLISEPEINTINFEEMIFNFQDIILESSDLDIEILNVQNAEKISIQCEDFNIARSKIGKTLLDMIKKIIILIIRLISSISVIMYAPYYIIKDLFKTGSIKVAVKSVSLKIKANDAVITDFLEKILKVTPNAKKVKRTNAVIVEIVTNLREWNKKYKDVPNWLKSFMTAYDVAITKMTDENFQRWCDAMMHEFDQKFGDDFNQNQSNDVYKTEFERWETDVLNNPDFVCNTPEDFVEASEEVANMKETSENKITINECNALIKQLERLMSNKQFETLPDETKSRVLKILDGLKGRLVALNKVSAQEAKDIKDIVTKLKQIESTSKIS